MPLLVKIDWHNTYCRGCKVIKQGAGGIEGNTTLQRWTAGEHAYTEWFLHIILLSNFLLLNALLKEISIF
jgi:hypothetical protein